LSSAGGGGLDRLVVALYDEEIVHLAMELSRIACDAESREGFRDFLLMQGMDSATREGENIA